VVRPESGAVGVGRRGDTGPACFGSPIAWVGLWPFLGLPGWRELVLVALVTLALYGRSGLFRSRHLRLLRPWIDRPAANSSRAHSATTAPGTSGQPRRGDGRVYWALVITASVAVAAWIVTRALILDGSPGR
jgi:hypothetical protein